MNQIESPNRKPVPSTHRWPALLLVLSGLAGSATAQTFPITFDARTLTTSSFNINYGLGGATSELHTFDFAPGSYFFQAPGSSTNIVSFTVSNTGTVDFDTFADGYASGRGTSTLTVTGLPLTVDATALSGSSWSITYGNGGTGPTSVVDTFRLLPGEWSFQEPASNVGNAFTFTLGTDGTLDFDPSHDGFVSGRGTSTLTVVGVPFTLDATALSHHAFSITYGGLGYGLSSQISTFRVVPSTPGYSYCWFQSPESSLNIVPFSVNMSGIVDYETSRDTYVSGRGTNTLTITGFPIVIDATAVPVANFNIAYSAGGPNQVTTVRQIPGIYDLRLPASSSNVVYYTVTALGTVDYDHALDFCVHGRGTNTLTVVCDPASPPNPTQLIADLETYIGGLSSSAFKNSNVRLANTLVNKLDAVLSQVDAALAETDAMLQDQLLQDAVDKLRNDILAKTNGCAATGAPDSNDWIIGCANQAEFSLQINRIITAVTAMI